VTQAVYLREALDDLLKKYAAAIRKAKFLSTGRVTSGE
jgi:Ribbon-helix-helix domain